MTYRKWLAVKVLRCKNTARVAWPTLPASDESTASRGLWAAARAALERKPMSGHGLGHGAGLVACRLKDFRGITGLAEDFVEDSASIGREAGGDPFSFGLVEQAADRGAGGDATGDQVAP